MVVLNERFPPGRTKILINPSERPARWPPPPKGTYYLRDVDDFLLDLDCGWRLLGLERSSHTLILYPVPVGADRQEA